MRIRRSLTGLACGLALLPASFLSSMAVAAPSEIAVKEINHLLEHVAESGCEFYRNGSWYDGNRGQAHLRDKYQWLVNRGMISAAADFIDKAASQSSLSGLAYKVRCKGQQETPTKQWLSDELQRYRAAVH